MLWCCVHFMTRQGLHSIQLNIALPEGVFETIWDPSSDMQRDTFVAQPRFVPKKNYPAKTGKLPNKLLKQGVATRHIFLQYQREFSLNLPHHADSVIESQCPSVFLFVCLHHQMQVFFGLSLALRSHDQFQASYRLTPTPPPQKKNNNLPPPFFFFFFF